MSIPVSSPETNKIASPFIHPRLKSLGAKGIKQIHYGLCFKTLSLDGSLSPLSAHDRYSSPVPLTARRQLFSNPASSANPIKYVPIAPKPPIVTVTPLESNPVSTTEMLLSPTRRDGYVIQPSTQVSTTSPAKPSTTVETVNPACKPRRGGSLELFYRKVIISKMLMLKVFIYSNNILMTSVIL